MARPPATDWEPTLAASARPVIGVELLHEPLRLGERSQRLRILQSSLEGKRFTVRLEGRSGRSYRMRIVTERDIASIDNGRRLSAGEVEVSLPEGAARWTRTELVVHLR